MPLLEIFPFSQNQKIQGLAEAGGWEKFLARVATRSAGKPAWASRMVTEQRSQQFRQDWDFISD